ncbi:MAG: hypothetical protein HYW50_02135 [Candidatus Diapherotrites archaeon]|nr:hypothetical protein [Candidatus Diapherotrites archaeon]
MHILLNTIKKIVSTEFPNLLRKLEELAKKHGLRFRRLSPLTSDKALEKTDVTRMFGVVYRAVIIFEPRKHNP